MNDYYITPDDYLTAEGNGINKDTLYRRVYEGWSIKRAITVPIRYISKDKEYRYWSTVAFKNGIRRNLFWMRVRKLGMDMEDAATTKLRDTHAL